MATRKYMLASDDDEDSALAVAVWMQMVGLGILQIQCKQERGGSLPGKAGNISRDFAGTHMYYMKKYFWPMDERRPGTEQCGPEQGEEAFEIRFRMPKAVFNRVFASVVTTSEFFRKGLRPDATGKLGISPLLKVLCAQRQLAYGIPADLCDDLFNISETTASNCLTEFCKAVVARWEREYLREPTAEDMERIERQFAAVGFPGCVGCLDCAGWTWKNCPKALQGLMTGKDGVPTLRMEAICDLDLWVWSFQFGLPGVFNDLNILEVSAHFSNVLSGQFPPVRPSYTISGKVFNWFYYLTDGIYPDWKVFIKTIRDGNTAKEKLFRSLQEGTRKCVERLFGVLFRRFKYLFYASELWTVERMRTIAKACVILHNMTVEVRREFYGSDGVGGRSAMFSEEEDETDVVLEPIRDESVQGFLESHANIADDIKVKALHRRLKEALVQHIWDMHGNLT